MYLELDDMLTEKVRRNKLQISLDYNVESTLSECRYQSINKETKARTGKMHEL